MLEEDKDCFTNLKIEVNRQLNEGERMAYLGLVQDSEALDWISNLEKSLLQSI